MCHRVPILRTSSWTAKSYSWARDKALVSPLDYKGRSDACENHQSPSLLYLFIAFVLGRFLFYSIVAPHPCLLLQASKQPSFHRFISAGEGYYRISPSSFAWAHRFVSRRSFQEFLGVWLVSSIYLIHKPSDLYYILSNLTTRKDWSTRTRHSNPSHNRKDFTKNWLLSPLSDSSFFPYPDKRILDTYLNIRKHN